MQNENEATAKTARAKHILFGGPARARTSKDRRNAWRTPQTLVEDIRRAFGGEIDLDPATDWDNPVGALRFYTPEHDGLTKPWKGKVFVNPPYSRVGPWIDHAIAEAKGGAGIYMLLPVRTDAAYHQRLLREATDVVFIRGRVAFCHPEAVRHSTAAFGSMIVGLGVSTEPLLHYGVRMWYRPGTAP